ncbi:MAG: hypothetical protein LIP03_00280 [Bacteroidales bacterium]|nr:hypothetical protein [Bacteroidales bacterium]
MKINSVISIWALLFFSIVSQWSRGDSYRGAILDISEATEESLTPESRLWDFSRTTIAVGNTKAECSWIGDSILTEAFWGYREWDLIDDIETVLIN